MTCQYCSVTERRAIRDNSREDDFGFVDPISERLIIFTGGQVGFKTSIRYCPFCGKELERWKMKNENKKGAEIYDIITTLFKRCEVTPEAITDKTGISLNDFFTACYDFEPEVISRYADAVINEVRNEISSDDEFKICRLDLIQDIIKVKLIIGEHNEILKVQT